MTEVAEPNGIEVNGQFWRHPGGIWRPATEHALEGGDCWCGPRVVEVPPSDEVPKHGYTQAQLGRGIRGRSSPVTAMLLEAMEESQTAASDVGDVLTATMLADIIEGYRGGWVSEKHARIALFSAERRIQAVTDRG